MSIRSPEPDPFPHLIIDGFFDPAILTAARAEFDEVGPTRWQTFANQREKKLGTTFANAGPACNTVASTFQHPAFIGILEQSFGIDGLSYSDLGGGLHRIKPGGHLDVHVDFNRHDDGRYRRLNCLVYLNASPHQTADLFLCTGPDDPDPLRLAARFNRLVVFETSEHSWHGHPLPLEGDAERRSLAAYYYTDHPPEGVAEPHSTIFAA